MEHIGFGLDEGRKGWGRQEEGETAGLGGGKDGPKLESWVCHIES